MLRAPPAAALVIQGSACVYSRKVEYLHTLVHQALAHVADKRCAGGGARRLALGGPLARKPLGLHSTTVL